MTDERKKELYETYRNGLLNDTIPFWTTRGSTARFTRCGVIHVVEDDNPRFAYERVAVPKAPSCATGQGV